MMLVALAVFKFERLEPAALLLLSIQVKKELVTSSYCVGPKTVHKERKNLLHVFSTNYLRPALFIGSQ